MNHIPIAISSRMALCGARIDNPKKEIIIDEKTCPDCVEKYDAVVKFLDGVELA